MKCLIYCVHFTVIQTLVQCAIQCPADNPTTLQACDLGAITKPWETQKKVAQKIADEFFYQVLLLLPILMLTMKLSLGPAAPPAVPGRPGEDRAAPAAHPHHGPGQQREVPLHAGMNCETNRTLPAKTPEFFGLRISDKSTYCNRIFGLLFQYHQVSYIDEICLPVYSSLAAFSEPLAPMLEGKILPPCRGGGGKGHFWK